MELLDCIKERRSIRKDKRVTEELIKQVVDAAVYAPSWKNTQVTRYYAIIDSETKMELVKAMPDFNKDAVSTAAVVFVATVLKARSGYNREGLPDTSKGSGWQMYDCALSNMLLCLEATELGLGTVIMGYYDEAMINQIISIPDTEEVAAIIPMGYPDEEPQMPKRKGSDIILKII